MTTKLTLGTFNVENLFLRYRLLDKEKGARFGKVVKKREFLEGGGSILMLGTRLEDYGPISKSLRKLTAKVITENAPDVLALQEVENLEALKAFNRHFLDNSYPYMLVIDGNESLLKSCASDPSMYLKASNATDLQTVFKKIADEISNIRLTM